MNEKQLVKESLNGWIADNKNEVELSSVFNRQKDIADKYGINALSYPKLVDTLRELNYKLYQYNGDCDCQITYVKLPKRIAL
jgi:hypothetical protein